MSVVRLRNGIVAVDVPTLLILEAPDKVAYDGKQIDGDMFKGQELVVGVHPRDIDDMLKWKGDLHGDGFDVVEVLSKEEAEKYFKQN